MEKSKTVRVVELHGRADDLQRTLSTLKKDFEGMAIPSELNKAFAKLEHSISSVLRKTEKGIISREDFHDTEKELSKIKTAFDNLAGSIEEINKASDKKLMSMLPEDTVAKIE
jgi:hypothetical protein